MSPSINCGPLPDVPNVGLLKVYMTAATHTCQNRIYYSYTGTPVAADLVTQANDLLAEYNGLFLGTATGGTTYISNEWATAFVTNTDLRSPSAAFGQSTGGTAVGAASQKTPANAALVLSHKVGRRFRGGHPRTYIGGITPDNTADGRTWEAGVVTDIHNWWVNDVAPAILQNYGSFQATSLVSVSYYDKATEPAPCYRRTTPVVDTITGTTASNIIRSQRRRVRNTPTPD